MELILHEIQRLQQDYDKCDISYIRELIISDIILLKKAVLLIN